AGRLPRRADGLSGYAGLRLSHPWDFRIDGRGATESTQTLKARGLLRYKFSSAATSFAARSAIRDPRAPFPRLGWLAKRVRLAAGLRCGTELRRPRSKWDRSIRLRAG